MRLILSNRKRGVVWIRLAGVLTLLSAVASVRPVEIPRVSNQAIRLEPFGHTFQVTPGDDQTTMNAKVKSEHDREVGVYFDGAATSFDTFYDRQRSGFMQWVDRKFRSDMFERFRLAFEALAPLTDRTVLDVGCGSGPYVVEAVRRGSPHVVGLDMAEGMLELARRRAERAGVSQSCTFCLGTFPQDAPQEVFDDALVMGVLDYVPDPSSFLSALAGRVRRRAVLSFPSKHWFRTPFRKLRYWIKRCPVYFFDRAQIERLMTDAGFVEVRVVKIAGAGMDYVATGSRTRAAGG